MTQAQLSTSLLSNTSYKMNPRLGLALVQGTLFNLSSWIQGNPLPILPTSTIISSTSLFIGMRNQMFPYE
jgi:hypothetical protein